MTYVLSRNTVLNITWPNYTGKWLTKAHQIVAYYIPYDTAGLSTQYLLANLSSQTWQRTGR